MRSTMLALFVVTTCFAAASPAYADTAPESAAGSMTRTKVESRVDAALIPSVAIRDAVRDAARDASRAIPVHDVNTTDAAGSGRADSPRSITALSNASPSRHGALQAAAAFALRIGCSKSLACSTSNDWPAARGIRP